ncbi:MAG: protoporphyrinogen oxidase HemJ [Xanthomonadales bacterium]|nr:protoporphyrinogen oxidase HemJ [Xanthomonadales bacterium]
MLWLKSFHIIFVVTWFAGLFYLPRLFVYHAMAEDITVRATLKVMERRLMVMMNLGGLLSWLFGASMLFVLPALLGVGWMEVKLALVLVLTIYHFCCAAIVKQLARDDVRHSHVWYRWFNEFPTVILITVVILAVVKPF